MECEYFICDREARFVATFLDPDYAESPASGPGRWHTKRVCEDHALAEYGVHKLNELPETVAAEKARIKQAKTRNRKLLAEATFPGSDDWEK